jgi:hypothetical protein
MGGIAFDVLMAILAGLYIRGSWKAISLRSTWHNPTRSWIKVAPNSKMYLLDVFALGGLGLLHLAAIIVHRL